MSAPSTNVRSLLAAAREDAPDPIAHEEMWDRVAVATGLAASAAVVGSAAGAGSKAAIAPASKLLVVGALIGVASSALGVLVAVGVMQPDAGAAGTLRPAARVVRVAQADARRIDPEPRRRDPSRSVRAEGAAVRAAAHASRDADPAPVSELTEEARLVTDARAALVAGDPARALALVRSTRHLSTRALEPEELGLEARALRALGRADEAAATELLLKRRFPGHALAR